MMTRLGSDLWGCAQCEYTTKFYATMKTHIESKHVDTGGFPCQFCQHICKTRQAMKMHMYRKHNAAKLNPMILFRP